MATRNADLFTLASDDDDSINTTSTAESEANSTGEYPVEKVLAEAIDKVDGQMQYLLKWERYPLHRCTWEKKSQIQNDVLLREWEREKLAIRRGEKAPFNVDDFDLAVETFLEEKEEKRRRRKAKRRKRGEPTYSPTDASSSSASASEDGEILAKATVASETPKRRRPLTPPINKKKGVAQPVVKRKARVRAAVSDDSDDSDDEDDMRDSGGRTFVPEPTSPKRRKSSSAAPGIAEPKKAPMIKPTIAIPATKKPASSSSNTSTIATEKVATGQQSNLPTASVPKASKDLAPDPASTTANAARKSAPTPAVKPALAKRTSGANVFAGDWAAGKQRKQRPRVSGATPKDSTDPKFLNLSTQNRYQKYSRNEPAPDPNALTMIDPKTGLALPAKGAGMAKEKEVPKEVVSLKPTMGKAVPAATARAETVPLKPMTAKAVPPAAGPTVTTISTIAPPKTAPTQSRPTEIHSAYGRRTPPRETRRRSPSRSPPRQTFGPRQNEPPVTAAPFFDSTSRPELPAGPHPAKKAIMCKGWQSGTCPFTADTCWFAHRFISARKGTTCFYWRKGSCKKPAEECEFAHWDTGVYAGPPGTYWKTQTASNRGSVKESDLQLAASSKSPLQQWSSDAPEGGNTWQAVVGEKRRSIVDEPELYDTADVGVANGNEARLDSVVTIPPVANRTVTKATASEAASDVTMNNTNTIFSEKDPRRQQRAADESPEVREQANMPQARPPSVDGVKSDLALAEAGIRDLDEVLLLGTKKGLLQKVCIHMQPERYQEMDLLDKFFTRLGRKVTHMKEGDPKVWNLFRTCEGRNSLLVLHPSELFNGTIPGLHDSIMEYGAGLRIFSIGVQHELCTRERRAPAYEAQRLFPHGGITFISDDVFVYYPEKATELIEQFLDLTEQKPAGGEFNKIAARPGIKDWMLRLAGKTYEDQMAKQGACTDLRWIKCYDALCMLCPPEDEDMDFPHHSVPLERSHLWSPWEGSLPSFQGRWESGDEEGATEYMVNLFAGEACGKAWKYRKFLFVYQRPGMERVGLGSQGERVETVQEDPRGWMKKYSHIGVVTPDQALRRRK